MRWSYNLERSYGVAAWLFAVAALIVAMVVVGGATRLTGSGLSITEWKPILGVVPPLSEQGWQVAFHKYQQIPQYHYVTRGISLGEFKTLYWWEWGHRLLARLLGLVFFVPLVVFLWLKRIPRRLVWRCWAILALGALQGLVGWWMVASGLEQRVSVAPERLATHLGLALLVYCACLWTALEAWFGRGRSPLGQDERWASNAGALAAAVYLQSLLGALVAGSKAGLVYNDWPLMGGRLFPHDYVQKGQGMLDALLHSQAAVQFNHRIGAYVVFALVMTFAALIWRAPRIPQGSRTAAAVLAGAVVVQVLLGVTTLMAGDPLWLALLHQLGAVAVLSAAVVTAWRLRRS